ncbi:MAG: tRNA (adenosine(37)-N6)-dimethylallyltransferase MiaA [Candidatus Shikimatogenerans sp. JK-2022]|nr:tRNA (adenosine(37)-N6)-dimethylallyltransferase MiaA [Candidatus Shikimatogenerans bostrichidophilus]
MKILISIVGPTSIGKTKLSIFLAKYYKTEIISCDSKQFYKELNIGTSKPKKKELENIKYHFINNLSIKKKYNIYNFENDVLKKLKKIFKKKKIIFLVGGSCLYEKTIIEGLNYFPKIKTKNQKKFRKILEKKKIEDLISLIKKKDFFFYKNILKNKKDKFKIIRALEVLFFTKKKFSFFLNKPKKKRPFDMYIRIGLILKNRLEIYKRINKKVKSMIKKGLFKEVKKLYKYRKLNSLNTIGYKEIFNYIYKKKKKEKIKFKECIEEIKKKTRNYAKRQITWYKKKKDITWFNPKDKKKIIIFINKKIKYEINKNKI